MKRFACPSCGGEVEFKSTSSVYAVCPWCESMLMRTDTDLASIGKMASLPDDLSPLQIGTEGRYEGVHFGIIGRLKIGWSDGMWNEWHILTDEGHFGWIGEAQGFFSISFEVEGRDGQDVFADIRRNVGTDAAPGPGLEPGFEVEIDATTYRAVDIKKATCIGSEGELPFAAPKGRRTTAIDLTGPDESFATIEVENGTVRAYHGRYLGWDQFGFSNLRPLEGW